MNKIRPFPLDRILEEVEWFGFHRSDYVENADANFGILQRDEEIAEKIVKTKEKYGFPQRFRAAYAKYTNDTIAERIFRISRMFHRADLLKAVTLALQSTNEETLVDIKRKNIAMSGFAKLQERYNMEGIPTYTELILGLPGETYKTFKEGIDRIFDSGQHNGLFIYLCHGLPNSEMTEPKYVRKHGLKFIRTRAMLLHGTPNPDTPDEYQEMVVETNAMPHMVWKKACLYSWMVQALHCMGLLQWAAKRDRQEGIPYSCFYQDLVDYVKHRPKSVLGYAYHHAEELLEQALSGGSWENVIGGFGSVTWPPEEGIFLQCMRERDLFYREMAIHLEVDYSGLSDNGPPPIPEGKEEEYGKALWYGRKGDLFKALREVGHNAAPRS